TSSMECYHRPWTTHTIGLRRAGHACKALGQHTLSNDVGHGMPLLPLCSTHVRTTSRMTCHHFTRAEAHAVRRRQAWHTIITIWKHTQSDDVMRDMPSSPLDSTHGGMTLGVACFHYHWKAYTVGLHRAWHAIMALGKHTRSDYIRCGRTSLPLRSIHGVDYVQSGMSSSPLDTIHSRKTSGV
ncbi:hypothetical protein EJD97_013340, partial [Solanum chilense]